MRRRQRFQRGPHAFPRQLQPVQRRHRGGDAGGIAALPVTGPDQAVSRQLRKQRVQDCAEAATGAVRAMAMRLKGTGLSGRTTPVTT